MSIIGFMQQPGRLTRAKNFLKAYQGNLDAAIADLKEAAVAEPKKVRRKPTGPVLIHAENLSKSYKVGRQQVAALQDVSIEIHEGEFVAFTGPSGSGKSTLLQLIGGLDKPTQGSVVIDGQDLTKLSDRALSTFRNKTIGFVFQFFYLQPFLNLETNLTVSRTLRVRNLVSANIVASRIRITAEPFRLLVRSRGRLAWRLSGRGLPRL